MELVSRDHTTQHYAQQHVKLTRDLLRRQAHPAQKANAGGNARVPSQSRGGM